MIDFDIDYQEELKMAVETIKEKMPKWLKIQINTLKYDLYYGPYEEGYQDGEEGNPDYYYHGFVKTAGIVRDWLDDEVLDTPIDLILYDEETDSEYEENAGVIDARDICKAILGKELYSTIY